MIKVSIKGNINFPSLNVGKELKRIADSIIIPFMAGGIDRDRDIDGKPFLDLEENTWVSKAKSGGANRKLVESGKLRKSFRSRRVSENRVIIDLDPLRQDVGRSLQIEGVGRKRKRFKFFGVSDKANEHAIRHMENVIKKATKSA